MTRIRPNSVVLNPVCVASTGDALPSERTDESNAQAHDRARNEQTRQPRSKAFRGAQFSADGTSIVTQHADQCLRTFVLPETLLSETHSPHQLTAHCLTSSATAISSYALYPHFNLQDPATTIVACAAADVPIRLVNVIYPDVVHAKYLLVNQMTEQYIAPSSLIWTRDGHRFVAGSKNSISIFDASIDGSGPILQHKLACRRGQRKQSGGLDTCRGIVNALNISPDGILAVGSLQRNIAFFTNEGAGECMTSLSLTPPPGEQDPAKGNGITGLAWSPCGTYLFVAERQSDCIQVYDVRNTFERVSCLTGRDALTMQPLSIDVVPTTEGFELWAGGQDGSVRMWRNPGSIQGEHAPSFTSKIHQNPVTGTIWHPQGAVLATCSARDYHQAELSAQIITADPEDYKDPINDMLKIWTV